MKKKSATKYRLAGCIGLLSLTTLASPAMAVVVTMPNLPPLLSNLSFNQSLMTKDKSDTSGYYNFNSFAGNSNFELSASDQRYLTAPSVPTYTGTPASTGSNYISANYTFLNNALNGVFTIDSHWSVSDRDAVYTESVSAPSPIVFSLGTSSIYSGAPQYELSMTQGHTGDASLLIQASLIGITRDTHQLFNVFDVSSAQDTSLTQRGTLRTNAIYIYTPLHGATGNSGRADGHGMINLQIGGPLVSQVPEPETWALFLAGLGLTGWMVRRRKAA